MKLVAAFCGAVLAASVVVAAMPVQTKLNVGQQLAATVVLMDPLTSRVICAGVVIEQDLVLTAKHCVNPVADGTVIKFIDGRIAPGTVVGRAATVDVALIEVDTGDAPVAYIDGQVSQRDAICAIGAPIGLEWTVSCGVVSAIRTITDGDYMTNGTWIQTDAAINGGNSGGPIFKPNGGLVGIVSWSFVTARGLSFAVPIDIALKALTR